MLLDTTEDLIIIFFYDSFLGVDVQFYFQPLTTLL